jgi:UDP-N-acetylglucosamine--N-acetylmuramyl-(pentapeptide) pyrophosphoryl-undecaprenol N-acetylglucosamine transferase
VDDHQTHNAQHLVRAGAAEMLAQPQLTPQTLVDRLMPLLADRASLLGMARAARRLARPDAAEVVAQVCREVSR